MSAEPAVRCDPGKHYRTLILLTSGLFAAWRINLLITLSDQPASARLVGLLLAFVEIGAAYYLVGNIVRSLVYLKISRRPLELIEPSQRRPRVALLYLACEDVDLEALRSLTRIRYDGPLFLIVHDDSWSVEGRDAVDRAMERLEQEWDRPIVRLRRPNRRGGKPGAVNWLIERTLHLHDYFVLLDNDSWVLTTDFIPRAIARFDDPSVAAVQFRSRGITSNQEGAMRRLLASAVDTFDVFARWYALTGLMPFLGHNAMVRTEAFTQARGLSEGVLSDDIDFTMRLAMKGRRVHYTPEIEFGERHPASFSAFRRRCQKWSYGCMQILGRHLLPSLRCPSLRLAEKIWLADFACFYAFQSLLIPYLLLAYVAAPLVGSGGWIGAMNSSLVGMTVLAGILSPTLVYAAAHGRMRSWARTAWCCALVYGSSCFATARGVLEYLAGWAKEWVPTNARMREGSLRVATTAEAAFGLLLFAVPLAIRPEILLVPSSHLFLAIFLFSPLVARMYHDAPDTTAGLAARSARAASIPEAVTRTGSPRPLTRRTGVLAITIAVVGVLGLAVTIAREEPPRAQARVEVRGDSLYVDGKRFQVQGIHYSPWLPGTGPSGKDPWPGEEIIEKDLALVRSLNVNTILVHDAPREMFDRAARAGLMVIDTFTINWQSIRDDEGFNRRVREIADDVAGLKNETTVLIWSLGNEIPEWVLNEVGPDLLSARLRALHDAVARVDPDHPITHQNWPIAKTLPLPFLEVVSFNLYPTWSREVAVRGYGQYITQDLLPVAAGRPLIITEFGANTLESSPERQAETLTSCWREIRARTAGGVVFGFVDEWWKNYDNPIDPADYWHRTYAPNDAASHDLDPEEYYGIFTSDRLPKPAVRNVREMFAPNQEFHRVWLTLPLLLLFGYSIYVFRRPL